MCVYNIIYSVMYDWISVSSSTMYISLVPRKEPGNMAICIHVRTIQRTSLALSLSLLSAEVLPSSPT